MLGDSGFQQIYTESKTPENARRMGASSIHSNSSVLKDIQLKLNAFLETGGATRDEEQRAKMHADQLEANGHVLQREREMLRGQVVDMEREVTFQKSRYEFEHEGKKELQRRLADLSAMLDSERELKVMFQ
jgi:hypothetical protein